MASIKEKFDSAGGFSVEKTIHIDEYHNAKNLNSFELKNSFYTDSRVKNVILRGINTAVLSVDDIGTQITIENNTINFITGRVIVVNPQGTAYSGKLESVVQCNSVGDVSILSTMITSIKDDIPAGQSWVIEPLGSTNRFSYSTTRAGTTQTLKWAVATDIISIAWT
jgi:Tfp pilus assembly pilus retraction ATPase PilT